MRGLTPIIAIIILLLIVITLSGTAYTFMTGTFGAASEKTIQTAPGAGTGNQIIIQNVGTQPIQPEDLTITVDGQLAILTNPQPIHPKESALLNFNSPVLGNALSVRVASPTNVITYKTDILTVTGDPKDCNIDGSATGSDCLVTEEVPNHAIVNYNSCTDGTSGGFPDAINNIYLDKDLVEGGGTIEVTCEICCYYISPSTRTSYAIAYNNGNDIVNGWVNIDSGYCNSGSGGGICTSAHTRNMTTTEVTVDNIEGTHYIRCLETYNDDLTGVTCDSSDGYRDHDDINFTVMAIQ